MGSGETAPVGVDTTRPSIARVYDYMLGGKDNFAVDRQAAEMALRITPDGPEAAKASRAFLRRVVRFLVADAGIDQILDVGSGLPTQGNVHEVAHEINPAVRVVYVDNDPMVLAHGRALLAEAGTTTVVQAEFKQPDQLLAHPQVRAGIDFDRPFAMLLLGLLHHVNDHEDPLDIVERMRAALPVGGYLAISHFHDPGQQEPEVSRKALQVEKIFNETLGTGRWRRHSQILEYFGDMELLEPGLVPLQEWRPDGSEPPLQSYTYHTIVGGLARKR